MRFFNTFIRIALQKQALYKYRVFSLLYVVCFINVMLATLWTDSMPMAVLALAGITLLTFYYTKKLTSPAHFLPIESKAAVTIYNFDNEQQSLMAEVTLDRKAGKFIMATASKQQLAALFLAENEENNDFYKLMLQAKTQYHTLSTAYRTSPDLLIAEALGVVTMLHSHLVHGAEFTERALSLPNSFPRKPTEAHTYTLQLIRIALNRMDEAIAYIGTTQQVQQVEKANEKMRETLRFIQM